MTSYIAYKSYSKNQLHSLFSVEILLTLLCWASDPKTNEQPGQRVSRKMFPWSHWVISKGLLCPSKLLYNGVECVSCVSASDYLRARQQQLRRRSRRLRDYAWVACRVAVAQLASVILAGRLWLLPWFVRHLHLPIASIRFGCIHVSLHIQYCYIPFNKQQQIACSVRTFCTNGRIVKNEKAMLHTGTGP